MLGKVALLERGFHLCQLHGSQHGGSESLLGQKVVRGIYRKAETRLFVEVIDIDDDSLGYLRRVVKRLRQNCVVCVSALGEVGRKFISLELLNTRHYFATGVVSLARMSGAALVPLFCLREADGQYRLFLEKPIALGNEGDEATAQAIAQYVRLLESYIRRYPEQWSRWYFPLFSPQEQGAVIDVNV